MEFGRVYDESTDIDFSLPQDTAMTLSNLHGQPTSSEFKVYVGASKWGDKTWLGKIYPNKTPDTAFLPFYCRSFNTVEFSPTFYNIYSADQIAKWVRQVADIPGFRFCPKFPQTITHIRRLTNAEEATAKFYQSLTAFGKHLGPLLLQLGENFSPKNFRQLKAYLEGLPPSIKVCVEVRHKDWFANTANRNNLFGLLHELNMGTIISDTSGRRDCVHMELTTNEAVIRFVGNNLAPSDYARLDAWVERLKIWEGLGLKTVYFFMHQNNERYVPDICEYFIKKLNNELGTMVAGPKFINALL